MIKLNDKVIALDKFGDKTLKCLTPDFNTTGDIKFTWCYDSDEEIFALATLKDYVDAHKEPYQKVILYMPYIPNARQDRCVDGRIFTLKSFAKLLNNMKFNQVHVLDPHSNVASALIDNIEETELNNKFQNELTNLGIFNGDVAYMYPDAGASKKYAEMYKLNNKNVILGNKHRNSEGRIDGYEILNFQEGTKTVIIRDDICSYGGTFTAAAKELRKLGVEKIILVISHCENCILLGESMNYLDEIYTTDDILTLGMKELAPTSEDDEIVREKKTNLKKKLFKLNMFR